MLDTLHAFASSGLGLLVLSSVGRQPKRNGRSLLYPLQLVLGSPAGAAGRLPACPSGEVQCKEQLLKRYCRAAA